jgi:hypothetical protein
MLNPMRSSACIQQAGPWNTAATLETRKNGFLMDDIRTLARSRRGLASTVTFSHPHLVNPTEYTEAIAIAFLHGDTVAALYKEPVFIAAPMPRPGAPPPPRDAWTGTFLGSTSPRRMTQRHLPSSLTRTLPVPSSPWVVRIDSNEKAHRQPTLAKGTRTYRAALPRTKCPSPQSQGRQNHPLETTRHTPNPPGCPTAPVRRNQTKTQPKGRRRT